MYIYFTHIEAIVFCGIDSMQHRLTDLILSACTLGHYIINLLLSIYMYDLNCIPCSFCFMLRCDGYNIVTCNFEVIENTNAADV